MALSNCSALGYTYPDSFCLQIEVEEEQDKFTVNTGWIVGAFFLGVVLGCGLVLILTRPFLSAWEKKKQQDEEKLLGTAAAGATEGKAVKKQKRNEAANSPKEKVTNFRASRFRRKMKQVSTDESGKKDLVNKGDVDPAFSRGMAEVILQPNSNASELEMADQDMASIVTMEGSMEEEKAVLMPHILAMLMKSSMEKREIPKNFYINFVRKISGGMRDLTMMIEREKEEAEEKLRNDPKLAKDPQALETEMQKLQTDFNHKQSKLQRDHKDNIRLDLLRSSGMSEAEVDKLISKLTDEMASVEEKLGLEQARQRRALEQRLARRKQALEFKEMENQDAKSDVSNRVQVFDELLSSHLKDASKLEGQRDEVLSSYRCDLDEIQKYYAKEYDRSVWEKSDMLQNLRLSSFFNLSKSQEKEKAWLLQTAEKSVNTSEFIKLYHDLMTKHHMEQETLCSDLDQNEVQELHKVKQEVAKEEAVAMDKATERQAEKLETVTPLMPSDIDKILRIHKAHMKELSAKRQQERQANMVQLQERLKQRLLAADEAEARDQKEQEVFKQEQMDTISRVLSTNMELSDEAKERVLREHEQNMQVLSNQLLRSKLRQQKSLEIKLNQRKARLAELKEQQRALQTPGKLLEETEKSSKETKLAEEIEKEEASFEEARQQAVAELRRQLAKETEEALKLKDNEIGLLIGRLQVGQARRLAVIEKQDATLKELQDQLGRRVSMSEEMPASITKQIIQQHYNHVTHLNQQLQNRREMQQKAIMQKIQSKKVEMEEQIETQLERDAQNEYTERQKRGAGYASLALMQTFLEQKHTKAMSELESDMLAELEKSKTQLNTELEQDLRRELQAQSQSFLTQLAAVSNLPKGELEDAVYAATAGRKSSKSAHKLAKELRDGVDREKSSLGYR